MDELKIEIDKGDSGVCVFRLKGPLTLSTLFEFQDLARSEGENALVIDLSGVPYMDSAGLGALLGVLASCQRHHRGFGIAGTPERIKTLFNVARVDGMLPTFDSVESAKLHLSKSATA